MSNTFATSAGSRSAALLICEGGAALCTGSGLRPAQRRLRDRRGRGSPRLAAGPIPPRGAHSSLKSNTFVTSAGSRSAALLICEGGAAPLCGSGSAEREATPVRPRRDSRIWAGLQPQFRVRRETAAAASRPAGASVGGLLCRRDATFVGQSVPAATEPMSFVRGCDGSPTGRVERAPHATPPTGQRLSSHAHSRPEAAAPAPNLGRERGRMGWPSQKTPLGRTARGREPGAHPPPGSHSVSALRCRTSRTQRWRPRSN